MSDSANTDCPDGYWKLVAEMYTEGDEINIMLLGLEMSPKPLPVAGNQMAMVPQPSFFQAIFREANDVALIVDLEQKDQGGGTQLMRDVPLQWRFIRLIGRRSTIEAVSKPKIRM